MAFLSGVTGFVKVGAATYAFGKWKLAIKAGNPKVTNFAGGGYQDLVRGVISATLSCSGAYDVGNMPLAAGTTYVFTLGLSPGVQLSASFLVTSLDVDNDVEDAPRLNITGESTGTFTASIT